MVLIYVYREFPSGRPGNWGNFLSIKKQNQAIIAIITATSLSNEFSPVVIDSNVIGT